MPCIKCGSYAVETSSGLCKECAAKVAQSSSIYDPVQTCPRCGMYYQLSSGHACGPGAPTRHVGETDAIKPPDWFKRMYTEQYPAIVADQVASGLMRMPWDVYFLAICDAVKLRSIDAETQNGSVIVNAKRQIVRTGYNAFPAGVDDSFWPRDRETKARVPFVSTPRGELIGNGRRLTKPAAVPPPLEQTYEVDKYMAMTHAEMNAVVSAGQDLHGCCIYTLLFPCHECAKAIITSGITRVVYTTTRENVSWAVAKELFIQAGVEMVGPEKLQEA